MTAKNRHKNSEKSAASSQDDAPKKSPKPTTGNGVSGPAPQGPRSGSCLGLFVTVLFYVVLLGAAGFGAFHLQQVVEEFRETSARHEESARQSAELGAKLESVVQQVESLRSVVDGLESSLGITRVELEGAISRMKRGEAETRKVEEALQKLQNNLLRDLSEGINEVKESRERDFSSLEKTLEERLAEVSQSIAASVAEFTEAQGSAQSQLADLKARLADLQDPKQELSTIMDTIGDITAGMKASDGSLEAVRDQIGAVRSELQTRHQEMASLSQEVQTVRSVVQDNVGSLKQSLSATEAEVQTLKDKSAALESDVEQAAAAVRSVDERVEADADQALKRTEAIEARVKLSESNGESLSASLSDLRSKMESAFAKHDDHQSALVALEQVVQGLKAGVEQETEALRSSLGELQSNMAALGGAQTKLSSKDASLGQQVAEVERRLAALEDSSSSSVKPEQLQTLRTALDGLEDKAAKMEGHEKAIEALQSALRDTTQRLAGLAAAKKKK